MAETEEGRMKEESLPVEDFVPLEVKVELTEGDTPLEFNMDGKAGCTQGQGMGRRKKNTYICYGVVRNPGGGVNPLAATKIGFFLGKRKRCRLS